MEPGRFKVASDEEKKREIIFVRLSRIERFLLAKEAERRCMTLSAIIREKLFGEMNRDTTACHARGVNK